MEKTQVRFSEIVEIEVLRSLRTIQTDLRTLDALQGVPHLESNVVCLGKMLIDKMVEVWKDPSIRAIEWAGYQITPRAITRLEVPENIEDVETYIQNKLELVTLLHSEQVEQV